MKIRLDILACIGYLMYWKKMPLKELEGLSDFEIIAYSDSFRRLIDKSTGMVELATSDRPLEPEEEVTP